MISPLCQFIEALKKRARHREPYLLSYPNEGVHGLHTMCVALQVCQLRCPSKTVYLSAIDPERDIEHVKANIIIVRSSLGTAVILRSETLLLGQEPHLKHL